MSSASTGNSPGGCNDPWVVFDYEVDMFRELSELLRSGNPEYTSLPHRVQNAVVESMLLHTRILVDILLSRGRKQDDIRLRDLIPSFHSAELRQLRRIYGSSRALRTPSWTLNKMLAHATGQRSDSFDYSALLNQLTPLIQSILGQVNAQRL